MKIYVKRTMFAFFPLMGWLLTAPVVFSDDLTAELQAQNRVRQDQKADRQELQEEQRIERQQLKEEQRAKRKQLPATQAQQQADRQGEKVERQEQKDIARATIHKEEIGRQDAQLQEEDTERAE
jgi:hypothetical protein